MRCSAFTARTGEADSGESAVIAGLCSVDGVLAVKRLRMNIDRPDCKKTSAGISIPPHAIACCGNVELISSGN